MNTIHDLGGMQGLGPIVPEKDEPVFHAAWEARVQAMRRAIAATGKMAPTLRPFIESLPAADYLRMSYYERWFAAMIEMLAASGVVTREEIETGEAAPGAPTFVPALRPDGAAAFLHRIPPDLLKTPVPPRYAVGQRVRARNIHPAGHTRLPRYARGRSGVVQRDHGVQAFPDTHAYRRGDHPQHVYAVRFAARELWGEQASPRDAVYLDLWEDYLEPA